MFLVFGIWQALSLDVTQHTPDVRLVLLAETEMCVARYVCVSKSLTVNEVLLRPHNWGSRFCQPPTLLPAYVCGLTLTQLVEYLVAKTTDFRRRMMQFQKMKLVTWDSGSNLISFISIEIIWP